MLNSPLKKGLPGIIIQGVSESKGSSNFKIQDVISKFKKRTSIN